MESVYGAPKVTAGLDYSERLAIFEIAGRLLFFEGAAAPLEGLAELLNGYYSQPISPAAFSQPDATIRFQIREFPNEIAGTFQQFAISGGGSGYTNGQSCIFDFVNGRVIADPGEPPLIEVLMRETLKLDRVEDLEVLNYAISTALRRCGLYELHSGAVVDPQTQRGVLFAGASGSGKSTITLQLVASGWQYLSDDVVFVESLGEVLTAYPWRRAFAVTESTVQAAGRPIREALMNTRWSNGSKKLFMPLDFFPGAFLPQCEPFAIFFPNITDGVHSSVKLLTRTETMKQLIRLCPWSCYDPVTSPKHLAVLRSLAQQCQGFALSAGRDLLRDPTRASELVLEQTMR